MVLTKEEIQKRYKEKILPENKNPYHFEKREHATTITAYNPMCGDKYKLYLEEEGSQINALHFHGIGCAISKAATSILTRKIEGMSKTDAKKFCEQFMNALKSEGESSDLEEELKILAELKNFNGRLDCIQLSWKALFEYLTSAD